MKKRGWIILLILVFCFTLVFVTACEQHKCQHVCEICGKCTDMECKDPVCADKCKGHGEEHVCQSVCSICGKCTNMDCKDPVCAEKCKGHILVDKIIVSTDDETHDGTVASPLEVIVSQGNSIQISYVVQPNNAENKEFEWTVGVIAEGKFTPADNPDVTVTDDGYTITVAVTETAKNAFIEGKAKDGSGVSVYLSVIVEEYTAVESITSSTLMQSESEEYDYELITAKYTNWDIAGGILPRGQQLLDGEIFGGKQAPRNLTYFGNLYNFGITVLPAEATDKDFVISYSEEGIVSVDAAGNLTVLDAGETIVTVSSYADPSITMKVKVTVVDSLYRGILKSAYDEAPLAANIAGGWNLDDAHGTPVQDSRYDDWHLVMTHSNAMRGDTGIDNNQKIFYMGSGDRPYGISLENNVGSSSGGSLLESASMMWAKVVIPDGTRTFNIKLSNNDKVHGQYRVVFVAEDGTVTVLSNDWVGFAAPTTESVQKFNVPESIHGKAGAIVIEHRVTEADNNAELQVKTMSFEGYVEVTSVVFDTAEKTFQKGAREFTISAKVMPENATNDKITYAMAAGSEGKGVEVSADGKVTVSAEALGDFEIIATSESNPEAKATFKLKITEEAVVITEWKDKNALLDENGDPWKVEGTWNQGVGEGIDLQSAGSYISNNFNITANNAQFKLNARIFNGQEGDKGWPDIKLVVVEGDKETVVRANGSDSDTITVNTEGQTAIYNLSAFIGKDVEIRVVCEKEVYHCVITSIYMGAVTA